MPPQWQGMLQEYRERKNVSGCTTQDFCDCDELDFDWILNAGGGGNMAQNNEKAYKNSALDSLNYFSQKFAGA